MPPWHTWGAPLSVPVNAAYPGGSSVGHGCGSAVFCRRAETWPGRLFPFWGVEESPNMLMIRAATPAACGEAIDVPWA
jgi:hypothetical protein